MNTLQTLSPDKPIPVVTIDGGAATGKGSVALQLAKALAFHYLDSGVYYRALAYRALLDHVSVNDHVRLTRLAENLLLLFQEGQVWMKLDTQDKVEITQRIRHEDCSTMASQISQWAEVREALLDAQRHACKLPGLIAEGRDMGTVVFPHAVCKIFLICDIDIRAKRRTLQLENQGVCVNITAVRQSLVERDIFDKQRAIAPLEAAVDAVIIDSSHCTLEEVVSRCLRLCRKVIPPCC